MTWPTCFCIVGCAWALAFCVRVFFGALCESDNEKRTLDPQHKHSLNDWF